MNTRAISPSRTGRIRVAFALALFFAVALLRSQVGAVDPNRRSYSAPSRSGELIGTVVSIEPDPNYLPSSCAIVATEAYHRVAKNAVWARLLHIDCKFLDGKNGGHMMTVWQLAAGGQILIYDNYFCNGTIELETRARDAGAIAFALARQQNVTITAAHLVE